MPRPQVRVLVGAVAKWAFHEHMGLDIPDHLLGPVMVAGRNRLVVAVRHPNSRGGVKSLRDHLTDAYLTQLREALAAMSSVRPAGSPCASRGPHHLRRVGAEVTN